MTVRIIELDKLVESGVLRKYDYEPIDENDWRYPNETVTLTFPDGQVLNIEAVSYGYGDSGGKLVFNPEQ